MAVTYGPETGDTGQKLVSSGGNVYSVGYTYVKAGLATRGRGFWTGKDRRDDNDPDVANDSKEDLKELLLPEEGVDDGFDDDMDPLLAMRQEAHVSHITRAQLKTAREIVEAVAGANIGKSMLTIGGLKVDLLLQDPETLDESQLVQSAHILKSMISQATNETERQILTGYAGRLARALKNTATARKALAEDIRKADQEDQVAQAKMPPKKAQTTQVNDRGKVAYKYPKNGDGKGPYSDGGPGDAQPEQDPEAISPQNQAIDPAPFAKQLGISDAQLKKLASKKTKRTFVEYFMQHEKLVKKHNLQPAYLAKIYDSLTTPPPPSEQTAGKPGSAPGPRPKQPGADTMPPEGAMKSLVVFNGGTLDRQALFLIDLLRSHKATTLEDIQKCLQAHYACDESQALRTTFSLLRRWEDEGLVKLYPQR